jgi:hypothetical protein
MRKQNKCPKLNIQALFWRDDKIKPQSSPSLPPWYWPQVDDAPHVSTEPHSGAGVGLVLADEDGVGHGQQTHQRPVLQELENLGLISQTPGGKRHKYLVLHFSSFCRFTNRPTYKRWVEFEINSKVYFLCCSLTCQYRSFPLAAPAPEEVAWLSGGAAWTSRMQPVKIHKKSADDRAKQR